MTETGLKTACHEWHVEQDGRMVDFAGWEMPIQYTTIVLEHEAVRQRAGLFDVAHMGRLWFSGDDAEAFLSHVLTLNASKLEVGQVKYGFVLNEQGGILDDVLLYRLANQFMLVVNASNREKIVNWLHQHQTGYTVTIEDKTTEQFMCALQGPRAIDILQPHTPADLSQLGYYQLIETTLFDKPVLLSRTGYTGEDGYEVILPSDEGLFLWKALMEAGSEFGITAAGLGCRDTLRLEAAMPLYGHELNEEIDPITAGLRFGVHLKGTNFIGHDVLVKRTESPRTVKRVGLQLEGRRIAREGALLFLGEEQVGEVTSGTFSPTLQESIGMGYLRADLAETGQRLEVDVRGKRQPAQVVPLPFYKRAQ
ncbi:Glycine cleavage system T protein [Polystyrenella longa]|uniref:Aminomethyltransferase n=1 Tax=Polystyrenella longa TaxID=2528007 RepID=A0A518CM67_9PLAN|nr:glycine cleavage system aminomethyltransferase GcvT [Polystyrenella longa]QDU80331.1 Glycine cleavage system T protein [Polystyrenella longa]